MSDSNRPTYLSCLKCDSLVSKDFGDIHEIECHTSSVNFTHPYIKYKERFMAVQVIQIEEDPAKANEKSMEPRWVKENFLQFAKDLVFLNIVDMDHCKFAQFSTIIISDGEVEAFFIPVSDDDTPPMNVKISEWGLQKFKKYEKNGLLYLRNLGNVQIAKEVCFSTKSSLTELNPSYIDHLINSICLKFPYILKKGELNCVGSTTLTIIDIKKRSDLSNIGKFTLQNQKNFLSIQHISVEDWKHSILEWNQNCRLIEVTTNFKDIDLNQSSKENLLLASPTSLIQSSKANTYRKKKRRSKLNNSNFATNLSYTDEKASKKSKYFKLEKDTICNVIHEKMLRNKDKINYESSYYCDETYHLVSKFISKKLQSDAEIKFSLGNLWSGIILTGHSGTGKTTLVHKLSSDFHLPLIIVSLSKWANSNLSETEFMQQSYTLAKEKAPSILFFDEIDSLSFQKVKITEGFTYLIFKIIEEVKKLNNTIILIGASNRPEEIPSKLLEYGRFDKEIILTLPDVCKKASILSNLISEHDNALTGDEINIIAELAKGFSAADLNSLVKTAFHNSLMKWKSLNSKSECPILTFYDFKESISSIVPSLLRQNFSTVKEIFWSDIFGYEKIKEQIQEMLVNKSLGTYELKGLLLFGPPGCSKTMFVRAMATETSFTYFPVKCSDLLSKYVGETERSLCSVFRRASMCAPSLVFMDEIDSICGERSGQGCAESVIVTELLSLIQEATNRGNVMIIGATNRPQSVDASLLSPGGFESMLYIDLPDCHSRCSIWKGLFNGVPTSNIDVHYLCDKTKGFSGAEIIDIYQKTAQSLMANNLENPNFNIDDVIFTQQDFLVTLENVHPRTSLSVLESNKTFYDKIKGLMNCK